MENDGLKTRTENDLTRESNKYNSYLVLYITYFDSTLPTYKPSYLTINFNNRYNFLSFYIDRFSVNGSIEHNRQTYQQPEVHLLKI
jgi:hypothetical protein